ncbi:helix-turn-helix domain-containing protein [Xanthobacter sediminis]
MDHFTPTGRQIAAARALTGLSQAEVASSANISVPTLKRMEASEGPAAGMANNVAAVVRALEAAGVIFQADGDVVDGGPGVRLKKSLTP